MSAQQIHTAALSEADLDAVSGGLSPEVGGYVGPLALSSSDVTAQIGAVQNEVLGSVGQVHGAGFNVAF
ncbi:hypothetical protein [Streptomyces tropicalis]|uniref:Type A2 lantipeptide n=1 Tax=Streptomyces tropicalis TaxID=3034234 RepID=A0ABT6A8I7_9ACTN|nr:hypothetical protein [Streptomyces tropicalis]MDF3300957.1 hypothetical protein [Streptomyces tropicalis]